MNWWSRSSGSPQPLSQNQAKEIRDYYDGCRNPVFRAELNFPREAGAHPGQNQHESVEEILTAAKQDVHEADKSAREVAARETKREYGLTAEQLESIIASNGAGTASGAAQREAPPYFTPGTVCTAAELPSANSIKSVWLVVNKTVTDRLEVMNDVAYASDYVIGNAKRISADLFPAIEEWMRNTGLRPSLVQMDRPFDAGRAIQFVRA